MIHTLDAKYSMPEEISIAILRRTGKLRWPVDDDSELSSSTEVLNNIAAICDWGPFILILNTKKRIMTVKTNPFNIIYKFYLRYWFKSPLSINSKTILRGHSSMHAPMNVIMLEWVMDLSNLVSKSKFSILSWLVIFSTLTCRTINM